jgi:hypothetical protein
MCTLVLWERQYGMVEGGGRRKDSVLMIRRDRDRDDEEREGGNLKSIKKTKKRDDRLKEKKENQAKRISS